MTTVEGRIPKEQDVFDLINRNYSRPISESEKVGLQELVKTHGAAEIEGRVLEIIKSFEDEFGIEEAGKMDKWLDALEKPDSQNGIHTLIQDMIDEDDFEDEMPQF